MVEMSGCTIQDRYNTVGDMRAEIALGHAGWEGHKAIHGPHDTHCT